MPLLSCSALRPSTVAITTIRLVVLLRRRCCQSQIGKRLVLPISFLLANADRLVVLRLKTQPNAVAQELGSANLVQFHVGETSPLVDMESTNKECA